MQQDTLVVPFGFQRRPNLLPPVPDISKDTIIADLLRHGFSRIDLVELPGTYSELYPVPDHGVTVWVDYDARYLVEGYLELENLVADNKSGHHFSHFGDGLLEINANIIDDNVQLEIRRCPELNVAYLSKLATTINLIDYLSTWRETAAILRQFQ